jgi:hypothetical protein
MLWLERLTSSAGIYACCQLMPGASMHAVVCAAWICYARTQTRALAAAGSHGNPAGCAGTH